MNVDNKRKIKVLHLASFSGNIGDVANHQGFYKKFRSIANADFVQVEIRKFYRNRSELKFDASFAEFVNTHDMLILGGGGFFDLKWDYSETGTTIDFSKKLIQEITIPVLVNGMGYHEYDEVNEKNVNKFKDFLEIIVKRKNWFISVRNDGSFDRMKKRYGNLMNNILVVPDSGFFFSPQSFPKYLESENTVWIGLNITNELFNKRFNKDVDVDLFNDHVSEFINKILNKNRNLKIILFPHTYQDVRTISMIIDKIEDKHRRERMVVAPLFIEGKSVEQVFDLYRMCSCVIGMRFHTNVCCIGMNIPTLGLAGHEQISCLYDEIGLSDRCIKINKEHFVDELGYKLDDSLKNIDKIKEDYYNLNVTLNEQSNQYCEKIDNFIQANIS